MDPSSAVIIDDDDDEDDLPIIKCLTPSKRVQTKINFDKPITPFSVKPTDIKKDEGPKAKLSMTSLLKNQMKEQEIEKKVEDIVELEDEFNRDTHTFEKENEVLGNEELNESQLSQAQEMDYSQVDIDEIPTNKSFLNKINAYSKNDFPDVFPGIEIFIHQRKSYLLKKYLKMIVEFILDEEEDIEEELLNSMDEIYEMLQALNPCIGSYPYDIRKCLWDLMHTVEDYKIVSFVYNQLADVLGSEEPNLCNIYIPTVEDFLKAVEDLGADIDVLIPGNVSDDISQYADYTHISEMESSDDVSGQSERDISTVRMIRKNFSSKLINFGHIVKLMTLSVQYYPQKYSLADLNFLLIIALLLSVERLVQFKLWDVKVFIGAIIDAYPDNKWKNQIVKVGHMLYQYDNHHHNMVYMVDAIPPTERGFEVQQYLAFVFTSYILHEKEPNITDHRFSTVKPANILKLIKDVKPNHESNYHQLHSLFKLVSFTLPMENITAKQKSDLEQLISYLKRAHGTIKECQGIYYDRTKVKAVILQLVSKLTFVCNNLKTQCHLDSYFEKSNKPLVIETIKSSQDNDEDSNQLNDASEEMEIN